MNIIEAVYHSLKRKKSADIEAERLGIPLSQYQRIRSEIITAINKVGQQMDDIILKLVQNNLSGAKSELSAEEQLFEMEQQLGITGDMRHHAAKPTSVVEVHEDLESGTSKITGISATEPRSAEEIIKILKIDTTKWKLSQYWNKEKGTKWLVSALVTRIPQAEQVQNNFLELLIVTGKQIGRAHV